MITALAEWAETLCLCMFAFGRRGAWTRYLDGDIQPMFPRGTK